MSSIDLEEIERTVRRLFSDRSAARSAYEGGPAVDPALWAQLAELGMLGIALPESHGGIGLGLAEECTVAETLSEFAAPAPVVSAFAAAHVLAGGDSPRAIAIAEALATGEKLVGLCLSVQNGLPDITVTPDGDGKAHLSGEVTDLFEGGSSDIALVPAAGQWWAVDLGDPAVTRSVVPCLDETRQMASLTLANVPAEAVSDVPFDNILSVVWTLIAAEGLGAAQASLDMTREYALQRQQFGQPIGRFQALKQKLADCLIAVEAARSGLWGALRSMRDGWPDASAARLAKAQGGKTAQFVTAECVQMHGAIGCTWEHDMHLLMRRAKHVQLSLGTPADHLRILTEVVLDEAAAPRDKRKPRAEMDLGFVPSAEDEAFIAPFRAWLDENAPPERIAQLRRAGLAERRAWQAELAEAGWCGLHWAKSAGGREASFTQQVLYYAEMTKRGLPALPGNRGLMLVGPTLIAHGNEFHKSLLEPTRRCDIFWAGGFSERGAGSDLASLRTRGVVEGDELVINGHKIWTSQAQMADWIYALIRTGPLHPKHAGISVVIIPMNTPGIEVRPIRRNNGDYHFNEVFFDDVRVPLTHIVGQMNNGWHVNRTTMVGEHLTNFLGSQAAQASTVTGIARALTAREGKSGIDHALRQRFAETWATTQIVRLHGLRNVARFTAGDNPGAEGSISKLVGQENEKTMFELMVDIQGIEGLQESKWTRAYLSTRASTIGGGTSEIHRNKLAERVLGMPRDPWADEEPASVSA